jgi:hypothetical protein
MVQVLFPLVESGRARFDVIWSFMRHSGNPKTVHAYITGIRARFRAANVPVRLVNDYGWGWYLELQEDVCG